MIHYSLSFKEAKTRTMIITVRGRSLAQQTIWRMPVWAPGSYMIREYARHVVSKTALVDGQPVPIQLIDKNTWQITHKPDIHFSLTYLLYAWDWSVRGCLLSDVLAQITGAAAFVQVIGHEDDEQLVYWAQGSIDKDWVCATTLSSHQEEPNTWIADNFDALIDCPLLFGALRELTWTVCDTPYRMAIAPTPVAVDQDTLTRDLSLICHEQHRIFGAQPPGVDRYTFLVVPGEGLRGGLEHRDSTLLMCSHRALKKGTDAPSGRCPYTDFLGLCSHEHFHMWWVKWVRPSSLVNDDLDRENYTTLLWLFEGMTSYYEDLVLARQKLLPRSAYLESLAETTRAVESYAGFHHQTVAESSFDTWIKYYRPSDNFLNSQVNYYQKGALIAWYTDLTIIIQTAGRCCLDDVLRYLRQKFQNDTTPAITESLWCQLVQEATSVRIDHILARFVHNHDHFDWEQLLPPVGLRFRGEKNEQKPTVGAQLRLDNGQMIVTAVFNNGSAETAALAPGDQLVALDGLRIQPDPTLQDLLRQVFVGQQSVVHFFRGGRLREAHLTWRPSPLRYQNCTICVVDEQNPLLKKWLNQEIDDKPTQ